MLMEMRSLVVQYSEIDLDAGMWGEREELLLQNACALLLNVRTWLSVGAEALFFSDDYAQGRVGGGVEYADIIAGVVDCVANTALLTLNKMVWSLYRARAKAGTTIAAEQSRQLLETQQLLDNPEDLLRRRQRVAPSSSFGANRR